MVLPRLALRSIGVPSDGVAAALLRFVQLDSRVRRPSALASASLRQRPCSSSLISGARTRRRPAYAPDATGPTKWRFRRSSGGGATGTISDTLHPLASDRVGNVRHAHLARSVGWQRVARDPCDLLTTPQPRTRRSRAHSRTTVTTGSRGDPATREAVSATWPRSAAPLFGADRSWSARLRSAADPG
jgi:hypothetical protein